MIELRSGDLFAADAEALVNPVNCVGVMGRGLALAFRERFPENFAAYAAACRRDAVVPGAMFVFDTGRERPRLIVNFPTKRHWRDASRMEDLVRGLDSLAELVRTRELRSIALPALGCGLGGLDWSEVRPRIGAAFAPLDGVRVLLFEPGEAGKPPGAGR